MYKLFGLTALGFAICSVSAQTSPYAGEQQREIKSLPAAEVADLLAGQGMGLAKAAELNGYPGPAHVLELAGPLALTPQQRSATEALMRRHKARARQMGAALVEAERSLDQAFSSRQVDAASLARLAARIGAEQAQLREEHLRTHLEQTALLDKPQIERYQQVRGYSASGHQHKHSSGR